MLIFQRQGQEPGAAWQRLAQRAFEEPLPQGATPLGPPDQLNYIPLFTNRSVNCGYRVGKQPFLPQE